jgi:uncharacterized protein (DUF302 family)
MSIEGIVAVTSVSDYPTTLQRLDDALASRGIKPMARIDHAAGAEEAGLNLAPMLLIVFGNPKVGTPLLQERPTIGIDLPLKLLVWEEGKAVRVGYNDPYWLAKRHGSFSTPQILEGMRKLLEFVAGAAAGLLDT